MAEPGADKARRSFGPTVLAGLGGATLAAVAGSQDWARGRGDVAGVEVAVVASGSGSAPLVTALALVTLAAWGVVLVLRGRARRGVAVVGVLASGGVLTSVVAGFAGAGAAVGDAARARGISGAVTEVGLTGWPYAAGVGAVLALLGCVAAVRTAPRWPAMGSRYDAPGSRDRSAAHRQGPAADGQVAEQELWRALDDGRDPTDPTR